MNRQPGYKGVDTPSPTRTGTLQLMLEKPPDILYEIMTYLSPIDLLNLARTTRAFRRFLMSRSSAPFWRAARRGFKQLSDCPADLSEPQYANILLEEHCHICFAHRPELFYHCPIRICEGCYVGRKLRVVDIQRRLRIAQAVILRVISGAQSRALWSCEVVSCIYEVRRLLEFAANGPDEHELATAVTTFLPLYLESRAETAHQYFTALIHESTTFGSSRVAPFSLAVSTYFACKRCDVPNLYPQVLAHACRNWSWPNNSEYNRAAEKVFPEQGFYTPSSFVPLMSKIQSYVQLYGLDPASATAEDMDKCNVRLVCPEHGKDMLRRRLAVHTWRSALGWYPCAKCNLVRATKEQAAAAVQLEAVRRDSQSATYDNDSVWLCALCPTFHRTPRLKASIHTHLRTEHDVGFPADDDMTCTADNYYRMTPPPVYLVSKELEGQPKLAMVTQLQLRDHDAVFFDFGVF